MANEIVFYQKDNGESPTIDFLKSLSPKDRAKCMRTIGLLEDIGIDLREPNSKPIGNGIYELRSSVSGNTHRIFYFHFKNNRFYLLNGFTKKDRKTPTREIAKAQAYKADIESKSH